MYSFYTTKYLVRLGYGVTIICSGKNRQSWIAEFHIIFPHTRRNRIAMRLGIDIPDEMMAESILEVARQRLQVEADIANRQLFPHEPVAPAIKQFRADESLIRQLWLNGLCTGELHEISCMTWNVELREFLERVRRLPVVGRHPADIATV
jgi:hypothetical protein